ncbi:MAG: 30S ribosome-binding factor RbfA [Actinomycetota bacterium]|nr:30S ribosome-binding factor RbfA [Actinomycetota bacterium]MDI6822086.1 30S ribosome-binding factor RbfA [Actinomycetota bacterium]
MMRTSRLAEIFKKEICDIIRRELKDPRIGFVTITAVEVSPDLKHATVFLSVLGEESEQEDTLEGLESARGFIKTELGKRIRIKFLPDLTFKIDKSIEEGMRISELLKRIQEGG